MPQLLRKKYSLILIFALALPLISLADYGYLTMPVDPSALSYSGKNNGINSWFDHTSPEGINDASSTTFTKYTGVAYTTSSWIALSTCDATGTANGNGVACYNGHEGIDFAVPANTNVIAAASGTVQQAQWHDPNTTSTGFGLFVRIYHGQYSFSTLYAHLNATTTGALAGNNVTRGQLVGQSGGTGDAAGANHLHFQVYTGDPTVTSSTQNGNLGAAFSYSVDPFGWATTTYSDPWAATDTFGYMWADPSPHATSSFVHYVTSSYLMTANTTWNANQIYIIQGSLTVSSSATLTIKQGAVVKFNSTSSNLTVDGKLDVQGTSTDPVYFTSIEDDTVGGDMNDDATATTPGPGNWNSIILDAKSTTTIKNAVIRYGGSITGPADGLIYMSDGYLSATSTVFASSSVYGLQMASGTAKITTSTFSGNIADGFRLYGAGNLTITTSSFSNNGTGLNSTDGVAQVDYNGGGTFTVSGNTSTGNYRNGFVVRLALGVSSTWSNDLPYVIQGGGYITVPAGKTLTINPGTVVKFEMLDGALYVNGTLNVKGTTSTNPIYFTSIKDDSVRGDTNNDSTATSPANGDWQSIQLNGGSSSTFNYTNLSYGGRYDFVLGRADIFMAGGTSTISGTSTIWHAMIASSSNYGLQVASGTVTISSSTLQGDGTTSTLQVVFNTRNMTSSVTAKQNWWSASSGPYNASSHPTGTTDWVGDYVNFTPWLTTKPL